MAGFSNNSYAKVWDIRRVEGRNALDVRISITRKMKESDEYREEFSGFVRFYGEAFKQAETKLQKGDRIKLLSVAVESSYNKDTKETRYYFKVFAWEPAGDYPSNKDDDYPFIDSSAQKSNTSPAAEESDKPW